MARQNVFEEMDARINEQTKKVETALHEQKVRETRNEFDARIDAIADKIIEFRERGAEEYLIEMLTTFLDVALDMRDLMDALEASSQGMQCIATAVGFIDEMLDFNMGMFEMSTNHNYGFWQRRREAKKIKKAIKNNVGRMKMVVKNMSGQVDFAKELVNEMKNATGKLRKKMGKGKKGASGNKAESYVQNRMNTRAAGGGTSGGFTGSGAVPPPPPPPSDGGIDDILI